MTTPSEMQAKVDKTVTNMDRLDDFVNGGPTATVMLDGGVDAPSLRGVVANGTATTAQLVSLVASVNTVGKYQGKPVFNTTLNKPVWATGVEGAAVWVDATGSVIHTPT